MNQGCFKEDWRVFQGSFQWVSRIRKSKGLSEKFQICVKGVSLKFRGCSKKVFRVLQGSLKGFSRKCQGVFKEDSKLLDFF